MDRTIEEYINGKLPRARSRNIETQLQILELSTTGDLQKDKVQIIQYFLDSYRSGLIRNMGTSLTHRIKYVKLFSEFYHKGLRPLPLFLKGTTEEISRILENPIRAKR